MSESKRHKHADLIIAWAEGAKLEFKSVNSGNWVDFKGHFASFVEEYRIKPEKQYRTPTDEDAKSRPMVEVSFHPSHDGWEPATLLFVDSDGNFWTPSRSGSVARMWTECRMEVK